MPNDDGNLEPHRPEPESTTAARRRRLAPGGDCVLLFCMVLPPVDETPAGQTAAMVPREASERHAKHGRPSCRPSWRPVGSRLALAALGLLLAACGAQADDLGAVVVYRLARPYQQAYRDLLTYAEQCQSKVAFEDYPELGRAYVEVFRISTLGPFRPWRFEFTGTTATSSLLTARAVMTNLISATQPFISAAQGRIPRCPVF